MTWHAEVFSLVPTGARGNALVIFRNEADGKMSVVKPLTLEIVAPSKYIADADYTMVDHSQGRFDSVVGTDIGDFLQAMLDLAWKKGLRPANVEYGDRELKAVRDHLADMQKLVFERAEK